MASSISACGCVSGWSLCVRERLAWASSGGVRRARCPRDELEASEGESFDALLGVDLPQHAIHRNAVDGLPVAFRSGGCFDAKAQWRWGRCAFKERAAGLGARWRGPCGSMALVRVMGRVVERVVIVHFLVLVFITAVVVIEVVVGGPRLGVSASAVLVEAGRGWGLGGWGSGAGETSLLEELCVLSLGAGFSLCLFTRSCGTHVSIRCGCRVEARSVLGWSCVVVVRR